MPSPKTSRRNLAKGRAQGKVQGQRSTTETLLIKLSIWQWYFDPEPKPSQKELALKLKVSPGYVWKVAEKAPTEGMEALTQFGRRVTDADLEDARRSTEKLQEQGILAPAPQPRSSNEPPHATADDIQREGQDMIREAHRKNPGAQPGTIKEHQERERRGRRRGGWFR